MIKIYAAVNMVNGKVYVGQTKSELRQRRWSHLCNARRGSDLLFHRAIRKHGEESFLFQSVGQVPSREAASNLEKVWILLLQATNRNFGYNLTAGGEGGTPTKEVREKMRNARLNNPEAIARMKKFGFASKGKKFSPELKQLLSIVNTGEGNGFFGKRHSPESRKKMSDSQIKRSQNGGFSFLKGRVFSESHKAKMSVAATARYATRVKNSLGQFV